MHTELTNFLKEYKLVSIATLDENKKPWIANVYYSVDSNLNLFFVSSEETHHSRHLASNNEIAFTVAWYNKDNLADRKAVQGTGKCRKLENPAEIVGFLTNHYKYFPLWKDVITYDNMVKKVIESRPYVIKPHYMKFWNDALFGDEGFEEFKF